MIEELIDLYCERLKVQLPDSEQSTFNSKEFKSLFDLVVADHSFRTTINVLLAGEAKSLEWEKCIRWIEYKKDYVKEFLDSI